MNKILMILACDKNGCIGKEGKLPWQSKSEMHHFLRRISFQNVVMGKATCLSLHKPMNSGKNYVLTTDTSFQREGFITINKFEDMIKIMNVEDCIVVGGASIYKQFLDYADANRDIRLFVEVSHMELEVEGGDSFFPLERLDDEFRKMTIEKHSSTFEPSWSVTAYIRNAKLKVE